MNYKIIRSVSELPDPARVNRFYKDHETKSGDRTRPGGKPNHGDRTVGAAFTHDDNPTCYYIPLRHHATNSTLFAEDVQNVPIDAYRRWAADLEGDESKTWVNHNVKFDAHFDAVEGIDVRCQLYDTVVGARLVDMQRYRDGYGLKPLGEKWLGMKPTLKEGIKIELDRLKSKDYGDVDASIMGEYACGDVALNRQLDHYIAKRRYEGDERVWKLEMDTTRTLFNIERRGLKVDLPQLERCRDTALIRMAEIEQSMHEIGVKGLSLSSPKDVVNYVVNVLGLPVVAYTDESNTTPSMNGDAIREYLELELVAGDARLTQFFKLLDEYRDRSQFMGLYADGWMDWITDAGFMYPSYFQLLATGRMSCGEPNIQQLNGEAKQLIIPRPGRAFMHRDYSQIEYRIIAALSRDPRVIEAYRNDPTTDFHDFVAKLCGIPRKPAKNVNFGIAFGMGEEGLIRQLARLLGGATAAQRAQEIYSTYQREFPKVRETANEVKKICRQRAGWQSGEWGWIRTLYGRRRALQYWKWGEGDPKKGQFDDTRKAFNTVVQGTAADIIKETSTVCERDPILRAHDINVLAIIHDDIVFEGPVENCTPAMLHHIDRLMCQISITLGVPLMTDGGISTKNWKDAG